MKLYSTAFQRSLLNGVKLAIRNSPELKRLAKRSRVRAVDSLQGQSYASLVLFAITTIGIPAGMIFAFALATKNVAAGLFGLSVFMLCLIPHHAARLIFTIRDDADLPALMLLPIEDDTIFSVQVDKFLRQSLWLLATLTLSYGLVLSMANLAPLQWLLVPVAAALTWLTMLTLAVFCAIQLPERLIAIFKSISFFALFAIIITAKFVVPSLVDFAKQYGPSIEMFLPTAWPNAVLHWMIGNADWTDPVGIALMLLLFASVGTLRARLRKTIVASAYLIERLYDAESAPQSDQTTGDTNTALTDAAATLAQPALRPPDSRPIDDDHFGTADYYNNSAEPKQGWLELALWNWLSPREKVLSELVFPGGYNVFSSWRFAFRAVVITCLLALVVGLFDPAFRNWIFAIGFFVSIVSVVSVTLSNANIFARTFTYGVGIPFYAHFPIGFRELSWLLLKVTLVQAPFIAVYWLFCIGLLSFLLNVPPSVALATSVKATVLFISLRYIAIVADVSAGTNDTSRFNFRSISLLVITFTLLISFAGLAIYSLVASWEVDVSLTTHFRTWAACLLAVGTAMLFHWVYSWLHDTNRFDLVVLEARQ